MIRSLLFFFALFIPLTDASRYYLGLGSISEIILFLLLLTWLLTLPRNSIRITLSLLIFLVLLLLAIASWLIALQRNQLLDRFSIDFSIVRHIEYLLVLFAISQLLKSDRERKALISGAVLGCAIEIFIVGLHWSAGPDALIFHNWGPPWAQAYTVENFRVWGSFGNPLPLVTYLATFIGILTVLSAAEYRPRWRLVWISLLVLSVLALLVTGSRTALIVLIIPIIYGIKSLSLRGLLAGVGLIAVITFSIGLTGVSDVLLSRLENFGTDNNSVKQRQMVIKSTFDIIQDYPLLGVGPSRFESIYANGYMRPGASWDPSTFTPENIFLLYGAELGIFALIVFTLGLIVVLWSGRIEAIATGSRLSRTYSEAASLGLICFLTASLVQASSDAASHLLLFTILGFLSSFRVVLTVTTKQRPRRVSRLLT